MFIKKEENFVCRHCGEKVRGSGYTNHCPTCLWSKHVDNDPGDRGSSCGGMMEPVGLEIKAGEYAIVHRCVQCRAKKRNKTSKNDKSEEIIKLSSRS